MDSDLLAHPRTAQLIKNYLISPTHGLGLSGENGAGKGYLAAYVAAKLLKTNIEALSKHPTVLKLDVSARKTGIEDVREVQKFLMLTVPGRLTIKRVVIIENIDVFGHEAQNALLKTLEEPPADTVIIVTFESGDAILPTIHSRLQHIRILPVGQSEASQFFEDSTEQNLTKAFFLSGGQAGLLTALMRDQTGHPLLEAINQARKLLGFTRYERLAEIDRILKNKDLEPKLLLDGLYRLIDASYRQSLKTRPNNELNTIAHRLYLTENAIDDLNQNIQAKLVLSLLFMEL